MAITVRKDKNGNPRAFQATVRMRGEKSSSQTFASYEAALEFETNAMAAIKAAKGVDEQRRSARTAVNPAKLASFVGETVSEIIDRYVESHPDKKRMSAYRETLKVRVGDVRVCELSKKWTRSFVERMSREPAKGRKGTLKESTVNSLLRKIAMVCKWRAEDLEVACPPLGLTTKFFAADWNDGRSRRLRGNEEERVRTALGQVGAKRFRANDPEAYGRARPVAKHYQLAFDFALETCAREAEIVNLPWQEIDMESREWQIPGWRTKTGRSRTIYLSLTALEILRELEAERVPGYDRVFHLLPKPATFSATFSAAVKRAGVRDYVFHDSRHEGISRLLNTGAMLPGAMLKMAGHTSLQMTMRYFNPQRDEILDRMDSVFARREAKALDGHVALPVQCAKPTGGSTRL